MLRWRTREANERQGLSVPTIVTNSVCQEYVVYESRYWRGGVGTGTTLAYLIHTFKHRAVLFSMQFIDSREKKVYTVLS